MFGNGESISIFNSFHKRNELKPIKLFFLIAPLLLFMGCSTKNYYQPSEDTSYLSFDDGNVEDIIKKNIHIVQFEDGGIVTDKFLKFKLAKDEKVLNYIKQTGNIATINDNFLVTIYTPEGKQFYQKQLNESIINASLNKNLFIILTAKNRVKLFDTNSDRILFEQKFDKSYSINAKIATPFFSDKLIAIPTLDGRLVFITHGGKMVKNNPISNKPSFNNVIFLDVVDGDIIAATPSRVIAIFDGDSNKIDEKIKDIIVVENNLYIFTNDGKIIQTDSKLNKIREKKYKFALFSKSQSDGNFIYTIEKTGYLIINKLNLSKDIIFDIPEIDTDLFMNKTHIIYDNNIIEYNSISKP